LIFDIAPFRSGYHALLGRTAFVKFNVVPHYAYLKLKMPGPSGVITINNNTECSLQTEEHTAALVAEDHTGPYRPGCRPAVRANDNSKRVRTRSPSWEPACVSRKYGYAPHGTPTFFTLHVPRQHNFALKIPWAAMRHTLI
jgi:hypothetical protein